jgi:hypothetical protein
MNKRTRIEFGMVKNFDKNKAQNKETTKEKKTCLSEVRVVFSRSAAQRVVNAASPIPFDEMSNSVNVLLFFNEAKKGANLLYIRFDF